MQYLPGIIRDSQLCSSIKSVYFPICSSHTERYAATDKNSLLEHLVTLFLNFGNSSVSQLYLKNYSMPFLDQTTCYYHHFSFVLCCLDYQNGMTLNCKKNIETNNIISMHSLKKFSSSFVLEKKSDFKHGFGTTMGIINII